MSANSSACLTSESANYSRVEPGASSSLCGALGPRAAHRLIGDSGKVSDAPNRSRRHPGISVLCDRLPGDGELGSVPWRLRFQ